MAGVLQLNGTTVATESGGAVTLSNANTLTSVPPANFPTGVSQGMGFVLWTQTSGTSDNYEIGGTGEQVQPLNEFVNGLSDTAWANPILSLSSNMWTMSTGYYWWVANRPLYYSNHYWIIGLKRYGIADGSGTGVTDVSTDEVNLGSTFIYTGSGASTHCYNTGILRVTSTTQKHAMYVNTQLDNAASTGTITHSLTNKLIRFSISFLKIG